MFDSDMAAVSESIIFSPPGNCYKRHHLSFKGESYFRKLFSSWERNGILAAVCTCIIEVAAFPPLFSFPRSSFLLQFLLYLQGNCQFLVRWRTSAACATGRGGSGSNLSRSVNRGQSSVRWGAVLEVVVASAIIVYIVGGTILNVVQGLPFGIQALPHYGFWLRTAENIQVLHLGDFFLWGGELFWMY